MHFITYTGLSKAVRHHACIGEIVNEDATSDLSSYRYLANLCDGWIYGLTDKDICEVDSRAPKNAKS